MEFSLLLTSKFVGSMSLSGHVPGQPEVAYEFPAQSPGSHKERNKMEALAWDALVIDDDE